MKKIIVASILLLLSEFVLSQEICDNGIDDDMDGLIDLNDSLDCRCISDSISTHSSFLPNQSFEDTICCPSQFSQMSCASTWIQASMPTSDYMNSCGFISLSTTKNGIFPFPDGNAAVGTIFMDTWQEYIGASLDSPLIAGRNYFLQFYIASAPTSSSGDTCSRVYSDIDISIFGNVSDNVLPFEGVGCPAINDGWQLLGSTNYTPTKKWEIITINFVPDKDVRSIVLGSPCLLPNDYNLSGSCYPYFYFDNLILNSGYSLNYLNEISFEMNLCDIDPSVKASIDANGGNWNWYYNGVSLVNEHTNLLNLIDKESGKYTARYVNNDVCYGSSDVIIDPNFILNEISFEMNLCGTNPSVKASVDTIGGYWNWYFEGDSLVNEHTNLLNLNDKESGKYTARYVNADGCYTSSDILIDLNLRGEEVIIPNVFSPNKDGLNDQFFIKRIPKNSSGITLSIFNRWGEKIHFDEGNNISWDGTYKNELLPEGTYYYNIELIDGCGNHKKFSGYITMFR